MKVIVAMGLAIFGVGLGVWWLEDRFGSEVALAGLVLVFVVACLVLGWLLSIASSRQVLHAVTRFNERDAMTDRYRQQTAQYLLEGDHLSQQALVIRERRLDRQLATQQMQQRWEIEQERRMLQGPGWGAPSAPGGRDDFVPDGWGPAGTPPRVIGQDGESYREFD